MLSLIRSGALGVLAGVIVCMLFCPEKVTQQRSSIVAIVGDCLVILVITGISELLKSRTNGRGRLKE
jgi:hypothetical protein